MGLYFCSLDWLKSHYLPNQTPSPLESVALGMVARCMSGAALIPITVVKTRYESGVYGYSSLTSALRDIYKNEGLRGMTCGLIPTLFRDAPFSGLYLMFYTSAKGLVPQGTTYEFVCKYERLTKLIINLVQSVGRVLSAHSCVLNFRPTFIFQNTSIPAMPRRFTSLAACRPVFWLLWSPNRRTC